MKQNKLLPVHPGEVLLEEFLKPLAISQYRLAKNISVPPRRVNEIVLRKRSISADTALRLSRFFGTSAEFWLNLQSQYDLDVETDRLGMAGEALAHRGGGALHPFDDLRVAEVGDAAAEVAFAERLWRVILAEQEAVLQRREKGHAEVVGVDPLFEAARFVVVVEQI